MLKRLLILTGTVLLIISLGISSPVYAQCGIGSTGSCVNCHLEQYPVSDQDIWHGIHARKDCCTNCHGGNCSAAEKDLAHVGIVPNPLEDVYTNCHACHPEDYWQRAEIFAAELRITPASRLTPTPVATSDPGKRQHELEILAATETAASGPFSRSLVFAFLGLVSAFTFFGISYLTCRLTTN